MVIGKVVCGAQIAWLALADCHIVYFDCLTARLPCYSLLGLDLVWLGLVLHGLEWFDGLESGEKVGTVWLFAYFVWLHFWLACVDVVNRGGMFCLALTAAADGW